MSVHLEREIQKLKKALLSMSALVEDSLRKVIEALEHRDVYIAQEVIAADREIDAAEVDIEEECLKVLALHQPVAGDLRFIVTILKINNDLERIADFCVNIGERIIFLARSEREHATRDLIAMGQKALWMLATSLDALVNMDPSLAHAVRTADDDVDAIDEKTFDETRAAIRRDPEGVDDQIRILEISRFLERVGDHAANIAEDVIYMTQGRIIRHAPEDPAPPRGEGLSAAPSSPRS